MFIYFLVISDVLLEMSQVTADAIKDAARMKIEANATNNGNMDDFKRILVESNNQNKEFQENLIKNNQEFMLNIMNMMKNKDD